MNKKTITVLVVLFAIVASLSAAMIQIGPTGRFRGDVTKVEDLTNPENYALGVDARVNFLLVDVAANALFETDYKEVINFDTFASANIRFSIPLVELALGAGVDLQIGNDYNRDGVADEWTINGQAMTGENFLEIVKGSSIWLRAAAGINLDGLGLSVAYRIPVDTIVSMVTQDTDPIEYAKMGQFSVSALFNIF